MTELLELSNKEFKVRLTCQGPKGKSKKHAN